VCNFIKKFVDLIRKSKLHFPDRRWICCNASRRHFRQEKVLRDKSDLRNEKSGGMSTDQAGESACPPETTPSLQVSLKQYLRRLISYKNI